MVTKKSTEVDILTVETTRVPFYLVGETPIILHRLSQKAQNELLIPRGKKNAAEKAASLKHHPYEEFRSSAYTSDDEKSPTLIRQVATSFKGALRSAALDIPGATKTQVGRLTYVNGEYVNIFGVPKLLMSVVRNSDMNRTPDIRTRVIIPRWACTFEVTFIMPLLTEKAVANLLSAAGLMQGIGDFRPGKGAGTYGQFRLTNPDDKEYQEIVKTGGRAVQVAAMAKAEPYDGESADMLSWFAEEVKARGLKVVAK